MDDNIKNLQDALEWLDRSIREEAELDGEMTNEHAIQLGFIQNMLEKFPCRNCDVGTAEEQTRRFMEFCIKHDECMKQAGKCPVFKKLGACKLEWAQMPYEEGGAK